MTSRPTSPDALLSRVRAVVEPLAVAHGVDVVEVVWAGPRVLRITIERLPPPGAPAPDPSQPIGWGVSLEDCAELSRDVSRALDLEDFIPHAYSLEVSSPGLERPLFGPRDFARFRGFLARAKLKRPAPDGQMLLRGTLDDVSADSLTMIVDGNAITVPLPDVASAHLVYELRPSPKGGPSKDKRSARRGAPARAHSERSRRGARSS